MGSGRGHGDHLSVVQFADLLSRATLARQRPLGRGVMVGIHMTCFLFPPPPLRLLYNDPCSSVKAFKHNTIRSYFLSREHLFVSKLLLENCKE